MTLAAAYVHSTVCTALALGVGYALCRLWPGFFHFDFFVALLIGMGVGDRAQRWKLESEMGR